MTDQMSLCVVVVTYRRVSSLADCLDGLSKLRRLPQQIIVTVRDIDRETQDFLQSYSTSNLSFQQVLVTTPGIVAARNAGLEACNSDIVAFLDDDTVPHADWSERVIEHFVANPRLGGLGGKDRLHNGIQFDERRSNVIGRVQWCGRVIPNQHLGYGAPREVDFLKGANMIFRSKAVGSIRFDTRLKGKGAQPNDDVTFCLAVRRAGWQLVYDPAVLVDHFSGSRDEVRHYAVIAPVTDWRGFQDFGYNEVIAVWDELSPRRRVAFGIWSVLIGTRVCPGILQAVRFTPKLGLGSWRRFWIAQRGKLEALHDLRAPSDSV